MTWGYIVSGGVVVMLICYLTYAILYPEEF